MSINVKNLTIGSHVSVDGKRVRVCGITKRKIGCHPDGRPDAHLRYARACTVDPIPLTTDLLEEIGFEKGNTDIVKRDNGHYICFHKIRNDRWRVSLEDDNCTYHGSTLCRYLHEAEAFLALHNIELIKD